MVATMRLGQHTIRKFQGFRLMVPTSPTYDTKKWSNEMQFPIESGQKVIKNEVLRMKFPVVENVCTSSDTVSVVSRGLQLS